MVAKIGVTPLKLDAALKSLNVDEYVVLEVIERRILELTKEGAGYAKTGTPEFQYASALTVGEEVSKADVEKKVGAQLAKIGFAKAMKNKWVQICGEKKENVKRVVEELEDEDQIALLKF